jgi:transposase-like protein
MFEQGLGYKSVARRLGCPPKAVKQWQYTFRAGGREALLVRKKTSYSHDLKIYAVRDFLEGGLSKPEIMEKYGIVSLTPLEAWVRKYRAGGPEALAPKPKGRRRRREPVVFESREEELLARIQELELELAIQKRINALADGNEHKRHDR